jgi:hypothetical protein
MSGDKADTTVNFVIAELEEWWAGQEWGCMMGGKMELDLSNGTKTQATTSSASVMVSDGIKRLPWKKLPPWMKQRRRRKHQSSSSSSHSIKKAGRQEKPGCSEYVVG